MKERGEYKMGKDKYYEEEVYKLRIYQDNSNVIFGGSTLIGEKDYVERYYKTKPSLEEVLRVYEYSIGDVGNKRQSVQVKDKQEQMKSLEEYKIRYRFNIIIELKKEQMVIYK